MSDVSSGVLYIAVLAPVYLLAMAADARVSRRRGLPAYRFSDSVSNLGCGLTQQALGVFAAVGMYLLYEWAFHTLAPFHLPPNRWWSWVLTFLLIDFCYYWNHRVHHQVALLWCVHGVHHQSETYDLTVAARLGVLADPTSIPFFAPLPLLGVSLPMMVTVAYLNALNQFWLHASSVGRLGPYERVFNSPLRHRVHHARNPAYRNRNYGGVLILWDRLFGSFQEYREEPEFGLDGPAPGPAPLEANLHPFRELLARCRRTEGWAARLRVLLGPPLAGPPPEPTGRAPPEPASVRLVTLLLGLSMAATLALLVSATRVPVWVTALSVACVVSSLQLCASRLENDPSPDALRHVTVEPG